MTLWSLKQLLTVIVSSVKRKIHFFSIGFGTLHATFGGNTKDCVDSGRSGSTSRENGKNGKEKTPNHFITTRFMCEVFLSINVTGDRLWHICNPFFSHMATTLHDKNNVLKYHKFNSFDMHFYLNACFFVQGYKLNSIWYWKKMKVESLLTFYIKSKLWHMNDMILHKF